MKDIPQARLINPLVVSGLLAAAGTAACGLLVPPPSEDVASFAQRLIHNPFVLTIGFVGLWAVIYALIQIAASGGTDSRTGFTGWLSGQSSLSKDASACSERRPSSPLRFPHEINDDTALAANLYAERWDMLAKRRMAPLSFAVWVLPLLGFVGTVVGISQAIGDLGTVFSDGDRQEALESVLGALRFAFDTTFAGLVLVIPAMALTTWVGLLSDKGRDAALYRLFGKR